MEQIECVASPLFDRVVAKGFRYGTHRLISPDQTVTQVRPFMGVMGITRVAVVTGLDSIGVPVVMVCRPNSRSLAVSQGKGLNLPAAKASGLMEAVELYHAERVTLQLKLASLEEMRYTHPLVDVAALPRTTHSRFHPDLPLLWVEGRNIMNDDSVWLPFETVHTNYTLPLPTGSGSFPMTSNGLASGNDLLEAISQGICEVVERDSTTLWHLTGDEGQDRTRVDLDTVDDPGCRHVLDMCDRAAVEVAAWETTSDIGIPSFLCLISERSGDPLRRLYSAMGMGCHPSRGIALTRALTEAAQSRVTYISGARDDMYRHNYDRYRNPDLLELQRDLAKARGHRRFQDAPTLESETFNQDIVWELERLRSVGIDQVVVIDLTKKEFGLPVARVVIPGLEGPEEKIPGYVHGARARGLLAS